ncbi:hypothetical protein D9M68_722560 [compost metagenome]
MFQLIYFKIGVIPFKVEDILNVRSPESVDTLGIIAHHTDILVSSCQLFYNNVLRKISVLILIHHNIAEFLLIFIEYIRMIFQQYIRFKEKVIKVHSAGFITTFGIGFVN